MFFLGWDPCLFDNGGCAQRCMSREGEAICKCYTGYELIPDTNSCRGM